MTMVGTCPAPGPGYTVRGGQNSILVEFEELEGRASRLDTVAEDLSGMAAALRRISVEEGGWIRIQPPQAAETARTEVDRAVFLLQQSIGAAAGTAADLRTAAQRYRAAEGRLERMGPAPGFLAALALMLLDSGPGGYPKRHALDSLPLRHFDAGALRLWAEAVGGRKTLRDIAVERVDSAHGAQETVRVSGSAAGLLERSAVLLREHDPGVIEVLRLERTSGTEPGNVFVVTLPGTQSGSGAEGDNPFDNYGNAEGRAAGSRFVAAAVAQALRQAQAEAGDAVILVGYSQGGIHAANTAGYLAEAEGLDVRFVLTAGAPAGDADIPSGTQALHLEHVQDWVPGADGSSNPDTLNRVTMSLTDEVPAVPGNAGLGPAHKLPVYLDGAAAADASGDPSLRASLAGAGALVGAAGVATRELYRFRRVERTPGIQVVPKGPPGPGTSLPRIPGPRRSGQADPLPSSGASLPGNQPPEKRG